MAQVFPAVTVTHADTPEGELALHPLRCATLEQMRRYLAILLMHINSLDPNTDLAAEIALAKPLICRDDRDKLGILLASLMTDIDETQLATEGELLICHPDNVIDALIVYELWRYITTI